MLSSVNDQFIISWSLEENIVRLEGKHPLLSSEWSFIQWLDKETRQLRCQIQVAPLYNSGLTWSNVKKQQTMQELSIFDNRENKVTGVTAHLQQVGSAAEEGMPSPPTLKLAVDPSQPLKQGLQLIVKHIKPIITTADPLDRWELDICLLVHLLEWVDDLKFELLGVS